MSVLPAPSFPLVVGESAGERVARILRAYAGCSLHARRDELAALVGRSVDDESVVTIETNCAMVALGVLLAAGCPHPLLHLPYAVGPLPFEPFARLDQIGIDYGAWRMPPRDGLLAPPGWWLWYKIEGANKDHIEAALSPPDEHGGGGRDDNAVTVAHGDEHWSWGRPIYRVLDPEALRLPVAMAPDMGDRLIGT